MPNSATDASSQRSFEANRSFNRYDNLLLCRVSQSNLVPFQRLPIVLKLPHPLSAVDFAHQRTPQPPTKRAIFKLVYVALFDLDLGARSYCIWVPNSHLHPHYFLQITSPFLSHQRYYHFLIFSFFQKQKTKTKNFFFSFLFSLFSPSLSLFFAFAYLSVLYLRHFMFSCNIIII